MRDRRLSLVLISLLSACSGEDTAWNRAWLTQEQRAEKLLAEERFLHAAETFVDPLRRGAAFYRAGDFKRAAAELARSASPEAAFNRGNAFVLLGKYDDAIRSYERALSMRPQWREARENLAIARARKERLAPPEDDAGGTGGKLAADEIVIGDGREGGTSVETEGGEGEELSDTEMQQLWLRRVETKPADFLRLKFSFQASRSSAQEPR